MSESNTQGLAQAVREALAQNTRVDEKEVDVRVDEARVTLTGAVDSAFEKRAARHTAEDVPGVECVVDELEVKNFVKRPDAELAEEVRHALVRDAFVEPGNIEVYASNGEVRLDGSVRTYAEKKAAEDVAWWTPGVINVESLLLVSDEDFVDVSPGEVVNSAPPVQS